MKTDKISFKIVSWALMFTLISMPIAINAQIEVNSQSGQQEGFFEGKVAGEASAKGNPLWILAGVGCGLFGVLGALLVKPSPPTHALMGKSSDYVLGYTEGYQKKARNANTGYACAGWAAFTVVYVAAGGYNSLY
jgi:hypothetical protein